MVGSIGCAAAGVARLWPRPASRVLARQALRPEVEEAEPAGSLAARGGI